MTDNEAIEEFKERLELIEKCYRGEVEDYKQALELGVKALEKQIAKKPIKSENQVVRYVNTYYCPTCELGITGTNIAKCCYNCGQKLDWSDENEID